MRRKDREVTGFSEIMKIVEQCEIVHLGLLDRRLPLYCANEFRLRSKGRAALSVCPWGNGRQKIRAAHTKSGMQL